MLKEIENRRSIRNYKEDNIDKKVILDIINAGIKAPSAKNNQPWRFVIANNDIKDKISDKMVENYGPNKTAEVIKTVPYLILVYNVNNEYFNHLSIGAAIENILLEAESMGFGTLWIGYIKKIDDYVKELVNVDYELVSAIAIGVKNENPLARPRLTLDEVLINEDWKNQKKW